MKSRWIYHLSGALLISSLQAAENFWDEIPLTPSTTRPSVVLDDYWNSEFLRVNREVAAAQNTQLVFFGDSITWSWSLGPATGRELWENQFAAYHPINMGNSGDITPIMLHRVTRGNLDFPAGKHPKVAVLLCGINNFGVTKSAEGKDSSTSYRRYLDGMLRRKGHVIDFVGSRKKHNDDKTEPDSYQFDPDHEGHWGKDSAWIAENMPRLLERNVPDVAVIHLGAEEIRT